VSSNSVCNHTRDEQIKLPLRGRPILLSLVWLQTGLDSTQSYYHYLFYDKNSNNDNINNDNSNDFDDDNDDDNNSHSDNNNDNDNDNDNDNNDRFLKQFTLTPPRYTNIATPYT